jgi:hypothetical protein
VTIPRRMDLALFGGSKYMPIVRFSAVTLVLASIPKLFAQQPPPSVITDQIMAMDGSNYPGFDGGFSVEELIAQRSHFDAVNDTYVLSYHPSEEHRQAGQATRDELLDFRELTYNCDAVIVGTPTLRRSALTASHHFVFSDYEVRIDANLSDRKKMLEGANRLVASRAGGETLVDGDKVRAIETEYPLFDLGEQYLFFLIRNPSGTYSVFPSGTFLVDGQSVKEVRLHPKNETVPYPLARIEQEIRKAADLNPRGTR